MDVDAHPAPPEAVPDLLATLQAQKAAAVAREDFMEANRLKQEIERLTIAPSALSAAPHDPSTPRSCEETAQLIAANGGERSLVTVAKYLTNILRLP
jgi:hypothetical protein